MCDAVGPYTTSPDGSRDASGVRSDLGFEPGEIESGKTVIHERRVSVDASMSGVGAESPSGADVTPSISSSDISPNTVARVRTGLTKFTDRERSAILDNASDKIFPIRKVRHRRTKIPSDLATHFDGIFSRRRSGAFNDRQNDRQMVWLGTHPTADRICFMKYFSCLGKRVTD